MNGKVPHIVQYQGSKRKLAPQILQYMPEKFDRLIEPFSGMAAISIATALEERAKSYVINDLNAPLVNMLQEAIERPEQLIDEYRKVWNEQFAYEEEHVQHFYVVRERFNDGAETPAYMLYLLARCVKGAVRYGKNGKFNQSPDKRRHGTNPQTLEKNVFAISNLLKGKATFSALDYRDVFEMTRPGDLVYMDPPYQGVTNVRDNRYYSGVPFDEFADALNILNSKGVDYLISYDGVCGGKEYGEDLPESLGCKKVLLNAGLSSQAILLGKKSTTFEALYISESLIPFFNTVPKQLTLLEVIA
jgi:DNA adenine methylase